MTSKLLFEFDKSFNCPIIGTDEAGRGPGAGGVFAAAVKFDKVTDGLIKDLAILNDSKKLTPKKRESIYDVILNNTLNKIVCVEVEEIEKINILNASLKAMNLACSGIIGDSETTSWLPPHPQPISHKGREESCAEVDLIFQNKLVSEQLSTDSIHLPLSTCVAHHNGRSENILVLVDGNKLIKNFPYEQQFVIKGDSKSASIAAASILAKVTRDRYMLKLHEEFPMYNWAKNAGYLTKEHLDAIDKYGTCKYHRMSFLKKHFAEK